MISAVKLIEVAKSTKLLYDKLCYQLIASLFLGFYTRLVLLSAFLYKYKFEV